MKSLALTVANKPGEGDADRARAVAAEYGLPFLERERGQPLEQWIQRYDGVFVWARNGLTLWSRDGQLRWSEGVAHLRVERIDDGDGEDDHFLRHARLRPGDAVLDCTLGVAQDALVAARAVGPTGRVVGVEKSLALYVLTTEGLATHDPGLHSTRVEVVHADSAEFLQAQAAKSFDVVVFDPMHERPAKAQPQFHGMRAWADHAELTAEMISAARRVARRRVLVKGSRYSQDLKKLGLSALPSPPSSSAIWAVVEPTAD